MATPQISQCNDSVQVEMFIAAPPARVFRAITDPAQTTQWWGQKGRYRITKAKSDLRPGGKWITRGVGADGAEFSVSGTYLEIDPPRLLVHTWNPSYRQLPETTVRWELEPHNVHQLQSQGPGKIGTGTFVRIRHSGFGGDLEACKGHGDGWMRVLVWIQQFIEEGMTTETRRPTEERDKM